MKMLKTSDLKKAFDRIIEKLNNERVERIEIPIDLYRIIPTQKWSITEKDIEAIHVGSIYDDLEAIQKLAADEDRICTYVDFDRVSSLLRIISQVQNPPEKN